jgi:hypothetical protein
VKIPCQLQFCFSFYPLNNLFVFFSFLFLSKADHAYNHLIKENRQI